MRKISMCIILIFLSSIMIFVTDNIKQSLAEEIEYIYFDLSAGNVTINGTTYKGYIFQEDKVTVQEVSGNHIDENKYYIYQSNTSITDQPTDINGIPIYERITVDGKKWGDYVTNNTNIDEVIVNWNNIASTTRKATSNYVSITGSAQYEIIIDNLWSKKNDASTGRTTGGIAYTPGAKGTARIKMKGDNRFGNIHYKSSYTGTDATQMIFEEYESGATLTVVNHSTTVNSNHYNAVMGASDNTDHSMGFVFNSGIVYSAANGRQNYDDCTAIGGGGNGTGVVTINGGTITAITKSSGTAIGGGIAISSVGGVGDVTITGGNVYAYNYGIKHSGQFIPAAAIGGGSSKNMQGGEGKVTITGGKVYAESVGGTAIGGGSSSSSYGGVANVTISGNAQVEAKSIAGDAIGAGVSIGGGTGGPLGTGNGGNANLTINGGILKTGSIGGGNSDNATGKIGAAVVKMNGGTLTGQIIMSAGTSSQSSFTMTDGKIDNINKTEDFIFLEEDGGAVHIESGSANITGGTIQNCNATNGGAIYIDGGDVELANEAIIQNCNATNGGAIYVSGGNVNINNGKIEKCKATSGAGIYISNGNITMNGGSIADNQAILSGGGIYASSDTENLNITIASGSIIRNIANEEGGGIGVNMGESLSAIIIIGEETCKGLDETHSHPIIKDNTANETGGGFCLHGDSLALTMYCGIVSENISIDEPGTANINQTGGSVTIFGGEITGGITIIGGDYIDGDQELPKVDIVYNSNISGNIQTKQAGISPGVIISLPKNIYVRENSILVGWSTSPKPDESDVIYPAGELYTIPTENVELYAVWLRVGAGSIETPVVNSGKKYEKLVGGINVMISSDSAFTTMMNVLNVQPNLYKNRTLNFSHSLKRGTTIIMIDISNENERKYYYYKFENDETTSVPLVSFNKMGETAKYTEPTETDFADEKFLFIVDLSDDNNLTNSTQMKLTRYSTESDVADIEQAISFTTTAKRDFNITWTNKFEDEEKITSNNMFMIYYQKNDPAGEDTRYDNREMAIVIKSLDADFNYAETKLYDGTNYYEANANKQFVIPLGSVKENGSKLIQVISKTLLENEKNCNLQVEIWISANDNVQKPFMGDKIATIEEISLNAVELPAFEISMNKRIYHMNELNERLVLNYNTKNIENKNVYLEIQKKNSNNVYEIQEDILNLVTNINLRRNGEVLLNIGKSGQLELQFKNTLEVGTYRVLIKVMDEEEIMYEIPYNFIVLE